MTPGLRHRQTVCMATGTLPATAPLRVPLRRLLAVTLGAGIAILVIAAAVGCAVLGWSLTLALESFVLTNAVMAVSFGGCGVILAWHRPTNPIGWLFVSGGFLQAVAAAVPPVGNLAQQAGMGESVVRLLATLFVYSWPWAIGLCVPLALVLFPDGRPLSRRWGPIVVLIAVTAPLFVLEMAAAPLPVDDGGVISYLTLPFYDRLGPLWLLAELRTGAAYLLGVLALALRYRRGDEATRRQLLWLLLAMVVVTFALVPWGLVAGTPIAVLFAIPLIPVAITVAVVRYQLLDIRLVVSRAVAWLVLSLAVIVVYAVVVALLERVVSFSLGGSAVATVILVLMAAPVLPRLQRLVDRAMYGDRANPTQVVSRLGEQLATPEVGLDAVATSIRSALRLPYVALETTDAQLAVAGTATTHQASVPLTYSGAETGRIVIGLRPGEKRLSVADRRVLDLLAAPLAVAVHATSVSAELQTSRLRLVGAREEERRRLRRELHDGLGPALTGIAFTADAAANLLADPERAGPLLVSLRRESRSALADVRRVVEDLRPPALDELGLVEALRQRTEQLRWRADGGLLTTTVTAPDRLPTLPAAVEVAAYRIVTEALTNIVRHSDAGRARVTVAVGPALVVQIDDDGSNAAAWTPGVGLQAMRERALELGGAFSAGATSEGGRVRAAIPLEVR